MDPTVTPLIGAVIGAGIALMAGPINAYFTRTREITDLRVALYDELINSYEILEGALLSFNEDIRSKNMDKLRSIKKLKYSDPLTFPTYDDNKSKPIIHQLQEATVKLRPAYFRLNAVKHAVEEFSCTPYNDLKEAEKQHKVDHAQLLEAARLINDAIESNKQILERINNGYILKNWHEFVRDRPDIQKKLRKRTIREILNEDWEEIQPL